MTSIVQGIAKKMYGNQEGWCQGLDLHNSSNHIKLHKITAKFSESKAVKFLANSKSQFVTHDQFFSSLSVTDYYIQTRVSSFASVSRTVILDGFYLLIF